jgi:hypothetical protein
VVDKKKIIRKNVGQGRGRGRLQSAVWFFCHLVFFYKFWTYTVMFSPST